MPHSEPPRDTFQLALEEMRSALRRLDAGRAPGHIGAQLQRAIDSLADLAQAVNEMGCPELAPPISPTAH
jgi:hypothetical protein